MADLSDSSRRIQLFIWGGIAVVALLAVVLIATAGSGGSGFRFLGQGNAEEGQSPDTVTVGRQIHEVGDDGTPIPVADSVEEFTTDHGDPPNTDFARLRIPAINVNAPVGRWIVDGSVMPEPFGPVDVAYYDLSGWAGLGGFPGEGGNAVFGAHVDLNRYVAYADDHYRGPAVFWALDQLGAGSIIEVDYAGQTLRYAVVWVEQVPAYGEVDWSQYFTSNVPVDSITLYTCGGEFDTSTASYTDRLVVRAERIQ
ncbi:MAG: class F sortase [Dehalococcoidia bacterium]